MTTGNTQQTKEISGLTEENKIIIGVSVSVICLIVLLTVAVLIFKCCQKKRSVKISQLIKKHDNKHT